MREAGSTYATIISTTGIPKSSLYYLFSTRIATTHRNVSKRNGHTANIKRDLSKAVSGMVAASKERRVEASQQWLSIMRCYPDQGFLNYIAGLYDGEGSKGDSHFSLSNANPRIIGLFGLFCRSVLGLADDRLRVTLHLHATMSKESCTNFWLAEGVAVKSVYTDNRQPRKPISLRQARDYHGTITIIVKRPLGLREALSLYAVFGGP